MARSRFGAFTSLSALMLLASAAVAFYQPAGKAGEKPAAAAAGGGEVTIKGDKNKRYFLNKPDGAAPAGGYKLLIVLPGGDGSAEFRPFVTNIAKSAVPPGYIVVQAVAPKWARSEEIVWPTEAARVQGAKVKAEAFIEAIIEDVKTGQTIDPKYVFTLGWSSGGPPSYAVALKKDSPVKGAFVAMSVFKPDQLPPLENGKGKPFYILHSPQDGIPMSFPEAARDKLAAKGAKTVLETYEGGHGWRGDVMGNIRKGVQWLDTNAGK